MNPVRLCSLLIVLSLLLSTPSASVSPTSRVVRLIHLCTSLDPVATFDGDCYRLMTDIHEGLVRIGPNGEPQPGVAERWHWKSNENVLIFQLRKDRRWSDGAPVVAEDFALSWRRILQLPNAGNALHRFLTAIDGADKCNQASASECATGLSTPDPHTLMIKFRINDPLFALRTLNGALMPVPSHFIAKHGDDWVYHTERPFNGAYLIANMAGLSQTELLKKELHLAPNTFHPDMKDRKGLNAIYQHRAFYIDSTNIRDLKYGDKIPDVIFSVRDLSPEAQHFLKRNNWLIIPQNDINAFTMLLNTDTMEPALIKAIKYILIQTEVTSRNIGNTSIPIDRLFTHTSQLTPFNNHYSTRNNSQRLSFARSILRDLGISPHATRTIKAIIARDFSDARAPQIIQSMLREEGIDFQIRYIDKHDESFRSNNAKEVDALFTAWFVSLPHPSGFFLILNWSPFPLLTARERNILESLLALPPEQIHNDAISRAAFHSAEEFLINNGGVIPLYKAQTFVVNRSDICGVVGSSSRTSPLLWMKTCE